MSDELPPKARLTHPVVFALLGALALIPGMFIVPLLDADEPRYAEASRQMLVTGDWVYPQFNGAPRHAKPALFNWTQAASYAVFGVSEFAARFPPLLATLATGLLLFHLTRRHISEPAAWLALAVWFTLPQTHLWGRASVTDPLLTLLTVVAIYAAFRGLEAPTGGGRWYAFSGLMMGLAALTKGPIGILLPGLVYLVYVALTGSWRRGFARGGPYAAMGLAVLVAAPWYGAQIAHYGRDYVTTFFGYDNLERYTSGRHGGVAFGVWWSVAVVLLFAFPFSVLIPRFARDARRELPEARAGDPIRRWRLLLTAWVLADIVLFAPSATQLPQYLMAVYPPLAMLVGDLLAREAAGVARRSAWVAAGAVVPALLIGGGFLYGAVEAPSLAQKAHLGDPGLMRAAATVIGLGFIGGGALFAYAWRRLSGRGLTMCVLAASLAVAVAMGEVAMPMVGLTRDQGRKELALIARERLPEGTPLVSYGLQTSTVVFYSHRQVVPAGSRSADETVDLLQEHPGAWIITLGHRAPELEARGLRRVGQARQYVLLEQPPRAAPATSTATTPPPSPAPPPPGNPTGSGVR